MRVNWEQLLTDALKTLNIWSRRQAFPEIISCRYNPGGILSWTDIMDNPGEARSLGWLGPQAFEAFTILKEKDQDFWDSLFPSIQ